VSHLAECGVCTLESVIAAAKEKYGNIFYVLQGGTQTRMTLLTDRREHSGTTLKEKITRDIR
jgi:hypothetical protein